MNKPTILIVDDEPINLMVLDELLNSDYSVRACKSGEDALLAVGKEPYPDLILLDIIMPGIGGYEVLKILKENPEYSDIPVIFITGLDSSLDEEKGGAVDYIKKPFVPAIVLKRIQVQLELKKTKDHLAYYNELLEQEVARRIEENLIIQEITFNMISHLAETRDVDTVHHIIRTQTYIKILANQMKNKEKFQGELSESSIARMIKAAPLHDIGKIGIPDRILLKPAKLTNDEFEIMKTHTLLGAGAIRKAIEQSVEIYNKNELSKPLSLLFLEDAEVIAKFHHEKWNGQGHPYGLKEQEIPLSARLMSVADVFDAVTTNRVYKRK